MAGRHERCAINERTVSRPRFLVSVADLAAVVPLLLQLTLRRLDLAHQRIVSQTGSVLSSAWSLPNWPRRAPRRFDLPRRREPRADNDADASQV
jgi:hypothetical protein